LQKEEAALSERWSDEEIAKLKSWAGKRPAAEIAADLGRAKSATAVKAHFLKVSLRVKNSYEPGAAGMDLSVGSVPARLTAAD
jgi:hypothetical protein